VIAERDVVYSKFPIPLINRLEKHYLVLSASLNTQQKNIVERIDKWVLQFSTVNIPRHQQMRFVLWGWLLQLDSIVAILYGLNKYTGHTLKGSLVRLFLRFILLALAIFLQNIHSWWLVCRLPCRHCSFCGASSHEGLVWGWPETVW